MGIKPLSILAAIFLAFVSVNLIVAHTGSNKGSGSSNELLSDNTAAATAESVTVVMSGIVDPKAGAGSVVRKESRFPEHWGSPPSRQTRDLVRWPGDYGRGSGTVRTWILEKMKEDEVNGVAGSVSSDSSASAAAPAGVTRGFPPHWGAPPAAVDGESDNMELPNKYGKGRESLAKWIALKSMKDQSDTNRPFIGEVAVKSKKDDGGSLDEKTPSSSTDGKTLEAVLASLTVGMDAALAVKAIEEVAEANGIEKVGLVPNDAMVTMDFRTDRIRVYHEGGKLSRIPRMG